MSDTEYGFIRLSSRKYFRGYFIEVGPDYGFSPYRLHFNQKREISPMSIFQQKSCSINFWGAVADGMPENLKAEACYEVAMGDVELDEGPAWASSCPTCTRRTTRTRSSSGELGPYN